MHIKCDKLAGRQRNRSVNNLLSFSHTIKSGTFIKNINEYSYIFLKHQCILKAKNQVNWKNGKKKEKVRICKKKVTE